MSEEKLQKRADEILASIAGPVEVKVHELARKLANAELGFREFQSKADRRYEMGRRGAYKEGYVAGYEACLDYLARLRTSGDDDFTIMRSLEAYHKTIKEWAGGEDGQLATEAATATG